MRSTDLLLLICLIVAVPAVGYFYGGPRSIKRAAWLLGAFILTLMLMAAFLVVIEDAMSDVEWMTAIIMRNAVSAAFAGLMTALALKMLVPGIGTREIVIVTSGWAISAVVTGFVTWEFGPAPYATLFGLFGGIAIAFALRGHIGAWTWRTVLLLGAAWSGAMIIRLMIFGATEHFIEYNSVVLGVISGLVLGGVGGGVTIWRVRKVPST